MYLDQNRTELIKTVHIHVGGFRFIDPIKIELNQSKLIKFFRVVWFDFKHC